MTRSSARGEMADALVSGTSGAIHGGSSPLERTFPDGPPAVERVKTLHSHPAFPAPVRRIFFVAPFVVILFALMMVASRAADEPASGPWGTPDASGVQMRLRVMKSESRAQPPSLLLDLRNAGTKMALYFGLAQTCQIQVDGRWYGWPEPIGLQGIANRLSPGQERDGAITITLTDGWWTPYARAGPPPISLKLTPGKHAIRARFYSDPNITTIKATSNEIELNCPESSSGH